MALPTSGAISLNAIKNEFGGSSSNIYISNYYRGGSYVPNTSANNSIPTSGTVYFSYYYGGTNQQVWSPTITNGTWSGYIACDTYTGYKSSVLGSYYGGSMNDYTINFLSNLRVRGIWHQKLYGVGGTVASNAVVFVTDPTSNSGWYRFVINGNSYYRTSMTFAAYNTNYSGWSITGNSPFSGANDVFYLYDS